MTSAITTAENSLDDLPEAFRHPHVVHFKLNRTGEHAATSEIRYLHFSGAEPRPERPDGLWDLDYLEHQAIAELYNTLLGDWSRAQFRNDLREPLAAAAEAWQTWQRAEQAMLAAYGVFDAIEDGRWRSARLALTDAQDAALGAAHDFDRAAKAMAELQDAQWHDMYRAMGEAKGEDHYAFTSDVAADLGVDTGDWVLDSTDTYTSTWSDSPLVRQAKETIKAQNDRLDRVGEVGDDEPVPDAEGDVEDQPQGCDECDDPSCPGVEAQEAQQEAALEAPVGEVQLLQEALADRTEELREARADLAKAQTQLDSEEIHQLCAADIEAAKDREKAAWATFDAAVADVSDVRLQRNIILVVAAVIIIVLTLAYLAR